MLIFKRGHTHINQDTLSEYLDGRLSGTAAAKVDRGLTECASCRQELDTLSSTVSLLRQMPDLTLPRSFVMPGPPPAPMAVRPPVPLRMPQWVYSGAAATAALVFAVLVSADATGLLDPELAAQSEAAAEAVRAAPESFQKDGGDGAAVMEFAAPQAPVVDEAVSAEKGFSVSATQETEIAEAPAEAPALRQAAVPPQALVEAQAQEDASAPAPVAAMAAAEVEEVAKTEAVSPPPEAALAAAAVDESAAAESAPTPAIADLTAAEQPPEPTTVVQDLPAGIPPPYNSITIWRVLEGLAALAAVSFLVIWLLRRRVGR